jgi:hypothetical protein
MVRPAMTIVLCLALAVPAAPAMALCGQTKEWISPFDVGYLDSYGTSVSMSSTVWVAGSPYWDRMGTSDDDDAGVVYPFYVTGPTVNQYGSWITPNDQSSGKHFGRAVAIDGETLVVGAENSAYVFTLSGTTWTQRSKLLPTVPGSTYFGSAVAVHGDTVVVGDPIADNGIGAIYIYTRNGVTWPLQQKITAPDPAFGPNFGAAVSVWGDTVVVGAPWGTGSAFQIGTAYVFVRSGMTWSQQGPLLEPTDVTSFTKFGTAVALRGDRLLVGAPGRTEGGQPFAGAAYFLERVGGTWTESQKVLAASNVPNSLFGAAVALGDATALVGRPDSGAGSARLFVHQGGSWVSQNTIGLPSPTGTDRFGASLAIAGDWGLAGAPTHDANATDSGSVWSLDLRCEGSCCVNGNCAPVSAASCAALSGNFGGAGTDCAGVICSQPECCPGDLNGDQSINGLDIQRLVDALMQGATCP